MTMLLENIQKKKNYLYKNLILVAFLSIGISLVANYLSSSFSSNRVLLWCGIVCILITVFAHIVSLLISKSFTIRLDSLFLTDAGGRLVSINRYRFSEVMEECVMSIFSENKAFLQQWEKAFHCEEGTWRGLCVLKGGVILGNEKMVNFVGEVIEYAFLKWFTLAQGSYFCSFNDEELEILTREKISGYLLQNRVLEMISKPYGEREKFIKHHQEKELGTGKICSMYSSDGVLYEHFDLKLPKRSCLYKKDGTLYIKNRNYTLKFKHNFLGFNSNLPIHFESLYLKKKFGSVKIYGFNPELTIKINPLFSLSAKKSKYLGWLDCIEEGFRSYFSFDDFIKKIGYDEALTDFIVFKRSL